MQHGSKVISKWIFMAGGLLFLLAASQWITLKVKRVSHRRDMQEQLEEDAARVNWQWLLVPETAMEWEVYGKEFWYQGQLYDVLTWQRQDSLVSVLCFEDGKEEDLVNNYRYGQGRAPGNQPAIAHRPLPPDAKYFPQGLVLRNRLNRMLYHDHTIIRDMLNQFEDDIPYPPPKRIA